jgi:SH3-like domain-containing protein
LQRFIQDVTVSRWHIDFVNAGNRYRTLFEGVKTQVDNHERPFRLCTVDSAIRHAARVVWTTAFSCALTLTGSAALAGNVIPGGEMCVVNVRADDELNVRLQPDADAPVVTRVAPDACGLIVTGACQRYWCPVERTGAAGWVNRRFISSVSPARYCVSGVAAYDKLVMRVTPSPQASVVIELPSYQCNVSLLPFANNGWQKVRVEEWEGWVTRKYLNSR